MDSYKIWFAQSMVTTQCMHKILLSVGSNVTKIFDTNRMICDFYFFFPPTFDCCQSIFTFEKSGTCGVIVITCEKVCGKHFSPVAQSVCLLWGYKGPGFKLGKS